MSRLRNIIISKLKVEERHEDGHQLPVIPEDIEGDLDGKNSLGAFRLCLFNSMNRETLMQPRTRMRRRNVDIPNRRRVDVSSRGCRRNQRGRSVFAAVIFTF